MNFKIYMICLKIQIDRITDEEVSDIIKTGVIQLQYINNNMHLNSYKNIINGDGIDG